MLGRRDSEEKSFHFHRVAEADCLSKMGGVGTGALAAFAQTVSYLEMLDLAWKTEPDSNENFIKLGAAASLAIVTGLLVGALHLDNNRVGQSADLAPISDEELAKIGFFALPLRSKLGLGIHLLADTLEGLGAVVGTVKVISVYASFAKDPIVNIASKCVGTTIGFFKSLPETRTMMRSCQRLFYDSKFFSRPKVVVNQPSLTKPLMEKVELREIKVSKK